MAAPSIPNLLSLRGELAGTGRGRGRGRGRGGAGPSTSGPGSSHDATIQGTDTDAAVSRLSAVDLGYLPDPFARLFVQGPGTRRLPIINRGTYTRTTAIDMLVDRFLATTNPGETRQIVSLGAGTDTRCLRLFTAPANHRNIAYHEIDFPTIMARKQAIISSTPSLRAILTTPEQLTTPETTTAWQCHSLTPNSNNSLTLHGLDLRTLTATSAVLPQLLPDAPTLLLSECCLCYLAPSEASALLGIFSSGLLCSRSLAVVLYEPVQPHDAFGRTMVSNLAARGIAMPTLEAYPTPADQERRLLAEAGLARARCRTVDRIWDAWVRDEEKERVDALEGGLDEVEEWRLLAGHYVQQEEEAEKEEDGEEEEDGRWSGNRKYACSGGS
ncbi:e81a83fa-b80e-471c-8f6d-2bcac709177b [Thermothielavioides terrestris]|uniref:Leucine carboxyl methyltransferase 1 n=1 Tax=Thermothielavioides terrestris TaxID=2587410 RepID=A0A3S4BH95_9PEZI|nr:e81a83fa-b80e-471c-8f6d-2bcac709177b [Thermothielavioides terrestris]